jgi:hypothetical protein
MYCTVELRTPKRAWLDLSTEGRPAYMAGIGPARR